MASVLLPVPPLRETKAIVCMTRLPITCVCEGADDARQTRRYKAQISSVTATHSFLHVLQTLRALSGKIAYASLNKLLTTHYHPLIRAMKLVSRDPDRAKLPKSLAPEVGLGDPPRLGERWFMPPVGPKRTSRPLGRGIPVITHDALNRLIASETVNI